jgi:hypothetical protein
MFFGPNKRSHMFWHGCSQISPQGLTRTKSKHEGAPEDCHYPLCITHPLALAWFVPLLVWYGSFGCWSGRVRSSVGVVRFVPVLVWWGSFQCWCGTVRSGVGLVWFVPVLVWYHHQICTLVALLLSVVFCLDLDPFFLFFSCAFCQVFFLPFFLYLLFFMTYQSGPGPYEIFYFYFFLPLFSIPSS